MKEWMIVLIIVLLPIVGAIVASRREIPRNLKIGSI